MELKGVYHLDLGEIDQQLTSHSIFSKYFERVGNTITWYIYGFWKSL